MCDDDPHMCAELGRRVEAYMAEQQEACLVRTCSSGTGVLDDPTVDILFLDIQMPGLDGLETAKALRRAGSACAIVFTTILKEYVFAAFEVEASDYLVKPIDPARFRRTMDRVLRTLAQRDRRRLMIRRGEEILVVPHDKIVYCEIHGRSMSIHLEDGRIITYRQKIGVLEKELGDDFFRCHRGCIVHLGHIVSSACSTIAASDGSRIPISRLRERDLRFALARYIERTRL